MSGTLEAERHTAGGDRPLSGAFGWFDTFQLRSERLHRAALDGPRHFLGCGISQPVSLSSLMWLCWGCLFCKIGDHS
jgi:hypothetical protein